MIGDLIEAYNDGVRSCSDPGKFADRAGVEALVRHLTLHFVGAFAAGARGEGSGAEYASALVARLLSDGPKRCGSCGEELPTGIGDLCEVCWTLNL